MLVKTISLEIYNAKVYFIISNREEVLEWIRDLAQTPQVIDFAIFDAFSFRFPSKDGFIKLGVWVNDKEPTVGLLAHECLHLTSFFMKDMHIPLKESSEEAWAYLHGFLVQKMYDFWQTYKLEQTNKTNEL